MFHCPRQKKNETAMTIRFTPKLLPSRKGNLGIFELNNPKPLHALSLDMINCMTDVWKEWMLTDVRAVLVKSSPASKVPAFCAGGDVKAVYHAGIDGEGHSYGSPGVLTSVGALLPDELLPH